MSVAPLAPDGVSAPVAEFVAGSGPPPGGRAERIAAAVWAVAAAAGAGATGPVPAAVLAVLAKERSRGEATVFGTEVRLAAPYAALANATAARSAGPSDLDFYAPVVAAALAMGEGAGAGTTDLLSGIAVGLEVAHRLELALASGERASAWDSVGTAGHVGAALAAARTAGVSAEVVASTLGFSATQASGLSASRGSGAGAVVAGKAAADGVESLLLCRAGLSGPPLPLEGRRGLLALMDALLAAGEITRDLGRVWTIDEMPPVPAVGGDTDDPAGRAGRLLASGTVDVLCRELNAAALTGRAISSNP